MTTTTITPKSERGAEPKTTPIKPRGFRAVVTFERDGGEPVVVRMVVDDSEPDTAARKAVFRALPEVSRLKWESVVIVLDRMGAEPWVSIRPVGRRTELRQCSMGAASGVSATSAGFSAGRESEQGT